MDKLNGNYFYFKKRFKFLKGFISQECTFLEGLATKGEKIKFLPYPEYARGSYFNHLTKLDLSNV